LNESGLIPLDVQNKVASQGLYDSFEAAAGLAKARSRGKSEDTWLISCFGGLDGCFFIDRLLPLFGYTKT
jgi:hypothetical protein